MGFETYQSMSVKIKIEPNFILFCPSDFHSCITGLSETLNLYNEYNQIVYNILFIIKVLITLYKNKLTNRCKNKKYNQVKFLK